MTFTDDIYEVGKLPPLGVIPRKMHAWTIRTERLGDPLTAFEEEIVDTPIPRAGEILVANYAAGINYNGIWAARGTPQNVITSNGRYGDKPESFHICGSESSGVVYAVGEGVENIKVGDEVLISGWKYDRNCPYIKNGGEPEYSPTYHIWGYESNWGAFAQFSRVLDIQCEKKPKCLNWNEAAVCTATGVPVNRMLRHWSGNKLKEGDVVLIWGGAGGLGSSAIRQAVLYGAIPVAVVSSDERGEYCKSLGAAGYINRKNYTHWGNISNLNPQEYMQWMFQATQFRNEIFSIVGKKCLPSIVLEHPGGDTLATSLFVCANGGMVVLCGATTGYLATIDLRYLWMYQKRIQGSHAASSDDCKEYLSLCESKGLRPDINKIYQWNELPQAHADMANGSDLMGKYVVRIVPDSIKE